MWGDDGADKDWMGEKETPNLYIKRNTADQTFFRKSDHKSLTEIINDVPLPCLIARGYNKLAGACQLLPLQLNIFSYTHYVSKQIPTIVAMFTSIPSYNVFLSIIVGYIVPKKNKMYPLWYVHKLMTLFHEFFAMNSRFTPPIYPKKSHDFFHYLSNEIIAIFRVDHWIIAHSEIPLLRGQNWTWWTKKKHIQ